MNKNIGEENLTEESYTHFYLLLTIYGCLWLYDTYSNGYDLWDKRNLTFVPGNNLEPYLILATIFMFLILIANIQGRSWTRERSLLTFIMGEKIARINRIFWSSIVLIFLAAVSTGNGDRLFNFLFNLITGNNIPN